jgi:hypothetical protein
MADILDILSHAEAVEAVNISDDQDPELERRVTAVSRIIDAEVGPVVQRTVTAEIHDGGSSAVYLKAPVVSVSLVRYAWGGSISTLSEVTFGASTDGYQLDLASGRLRRRYGGSVSTWGTDSQVEVTYVAGRYADTASVDERFKECAAAVLRRLWKRESATWAQSSAFFEQLDPAGGPQLGFFRIAKPIIDEMLWDELKLPGIA